MGKKKCFSSRKYHREKSIKLFVASLTGFANTVYAASAPELIGGSDDAMNAYAAFLNANQQLAPISGLPSGGNSIINAVAINSSGTGLIAGRDGIDGYAAFVNSNGIIVPFSISFANGALTTAEINTSGLGLVGGYSVSQTGYAAYLSPDGTITSLPISANVVESTALNDSGVGLIGGEGSGAPYATYTASDGTLTPITTPGVAGHLYSVAINNLGKGVIGGWADPGMYAAFVTPDGTATPLSSLPSDFGIIYSVAINSSGNALIGGINIISDNAYLGSVNSGGTVTPLFNTPFAGSITRVALNDSGTGLAAGDAGGTVYAALVQPNGNLVPLFNSPTTGSIHAVALNKEGIGLISADISGPYLALVAPNGTLTQISVANVSGIQDVAITSLNTIPNQAVPSSSGPYGAAFHTQLAATSALKTHFIHKNKIWSKHKLHTSTKNRRNIALNDELLAYNDGILPGLSQNHLAMNPKTESQPLGAAPITQNNSLWVEPFGNYVHVKQQDSVPGSTNKIGGILIGYDREEDNYIVGAAFGYAYDGIHYAHSLGHGHLQEELASLYGSYYTDHFWLAAAVWGGAYQLHNKRLTLSQLPSTGRTHGWILDPHFELASPWRIGHSDRYYIEPFASVDWIKNWQHSYTESGSSGLNLEMPSINNSLLQSEAGLRFYERFVYEWGDFCLEEKLSYINQTPFGDRSATTSFVNSASTFPVAIGNSKVQNLGAVQILGAFVPRNSSVSGGFSLEAAAGDGYQTYFGSLFCGVDF